jgi:PKD repeat protein
VTGGALPTGLTLLPSGSFSGAPAELGTFAFTVTATDANGCTGVQSYTLTVCAALTVSPATLLGATVGVPYSQTIGVSGGTGPYLFTATGLPSSLTLDPVSGVLSGTSTLPGVFPVTVTVTDANGCTGMQTYVLTVCPILALSPESLPDGAVGIAYSQTIVASRGTAPYQYSATGLPSSLTISQAGGVLSGTPTTPGTLTFTVTAADANGCAVSHAYTIRVTDVPPSIADLTLSPTGPDFTLAVTGSGFVSGAVIVVNGVSYPATFVSPNLVTVGLPASAVPTTGSITVTVTNPGPTGGTSNPATLTFCSPPDAPQNATIAPLGNPTGPLTATDFLLVRWQAPASGPTPAGYQYRINGDPYTTVVGATSAIAPPRGSNDPITLSVRAICNPDVAGPEISSQTYSLAPPVADFTFSAARINSPVTFTDTSAPQATSWLWIFDDGGTSTLQSPTHTFTTAGTHRVALIASNGSGSSLRIKDVGVSASSSGGGAVTSSIRFFEPSHGSRWRLPEVSISGDSPIWLELTSEASEETVAYLRFLDPDGQLVMERRLSVAPGQTAINDVTAYGLEGTYTIEIVADRRVTPVLAEPAELPQRERSRPDEIP